MTPTDQTPTELEQRLAEERDALGISPGGGKHPADAFPGERGTWPESTVTTPGGIEDAWNAFRPDLDPDGTYA